MRTLGKLRHDWRWLRRSHCWFCVLCGVAVVWEHIAVVPGYGWGQAAQGFTSHAPRLKLPRKPPQAGSALAVRQLDLTFAKDD